MTAEKRSQTTLQDLMDEAFGNYMIAQITNNPVEIIESAHKIHELTHLEYEHEDASVGQIICLYLKADAETKKLFKQVLEGFRKEESPCKETTTIGKK